MVKMGALAALGTVACSSKDHFQNYYSMVMPYLKVILMSAINEPNRMLLAKSIECITMVWTAVGKEKFKADMELLIISNIVLKVLLSWQESQMETDDPMRNHILQTWGRLCKCLGQEFLPYIGVAIPHLLRSAKLRGYITFKFEDSDDENESIKIVTHGSEKVGIKTAVLEEKAMACNMLCCCASELKEGFYLWIDEVAHTLVPLLNFNFHEGIRAAAASAMPILLRSAKTAIEKRNIQGFLESPFKKLLTYILPALVGALTKISGLFLEKPQAELFLDVITQILMTCLVGKIDKKNKGKDISAEEWELLKDEFKQDENIYNKAGDCLVTFIRAYRASLSSFFGKLSSCIEPMWGNDKTGKERKFALHIFHTILEQGQEEALRHYESVLQFLLKACCYHENPEVQLVAACGIGFCAEFGRSAFSPIVKEALDVLLGDPKALHPHNAMVHDVAVSALGKMFWFHHRSIKSDEVLFMKLISHFPLKNDLDEAKLVHDQLCLMVQKSEQELLGPKRSYLICIIPIFAEETI